MCDAPLEKLLKASRVLPMMCLSGFTPEGWAISFSAINNNQWMTSIGIDHPCTPHDQMMVRGKNFSMTATRPYKEFVVRTLLDTMLNPVKPDETGPPHRHLQILVAFRMRKSYQFIEEHMSRIGVLCVQETREAAQGSASKYGNHPDGRNSICCDNCEAMEGVEGLWDGAKFDRCSACKKVRYCSSECQKAHWPKHKKDCKRFKAEAAAARQRQLLSGGGTELQSGSYIQLQSGWGNKLQSGSYTQLRSGGCSELQLGSYTQLRSGSGNELQSGSCTQLRPGSGTEVQPGSYTQLQSGSCTQLRPGSGTERQPGSYTQLLSGSGTELQSGS
eukprot:gene28747-31926_t